MSDEKKKIYFTDPQLEFRYTAAHTSVIVAGRRFGKTHGIISPWYLRNVQHLPRSAGGIVGATFQQLLTRTLPGTFRALEDMGYKRGVHYFVGIKPPKTIGFQEPVIKPVSYDHVISWYNGSVSYLISQDVPGSSNSLTLQYVMGDEAKFLNFDKLKDETFPANGGFKGPWKNSPWLNSMLFVSDMPTTKKGSWFLNYKKKMDPDLINMIQFLALERARIAEKKDKTSYDLRLLKEYTIRLVQFRSIAVYYREWSTIENIELLGKKYIADMKRDLPPLVFLTSILCIKPGKLKDGFYPSLQEMHFYTAFNNSYLLNLGYDLDKAAAQDCRQDGDLDLDKPICVSFDYNANINWLVAGQAEGIKMKVIKSFYVKYNRKLRELVDDFCLYYKHHREKKVIYYFDTTALGSNYAVNDEDFASVICSQFHKNKWSVTRVHMGIPIKHHEKYQMIDQAFKGQKYLYPQINKDNNEALKLAMEQCGVRIGPTGWQKDKGGEKLAETEEDLLEYRTDGTDAFDTLFLGMNLFAQHYAGSAVPFTGGVLN